MFRTRSKQCDFDPQVTLPEDRPLRILRIIDRLNVGGPTKHVAWLSAGLAGEQFQTTLVAGSVPENEGDLSSFARSLGVEPVIIPEMSREISFKDFTVLVKLIRLLHSIKPAIVHTHKAKAGALGRLATLIYRWSTPSALWLQPRRCRVIHTFHGHIFHSYYGRTKTRIFLAIERILARWCTNTIVAISREQQREIQEDFRVGRAEQFEVIPLGVDSYPAPAARGQLRKELAVPSGQFLVGAIGRLCPIKNYAMLLQAVALLLRSGIDARLVFVGDGELRSELESMSKALAISDRVIFLGYREDAASLCEDFDAVALSSLNEGTPLSLIEAMASGRPVVATQVGGIVDILGERQARMGRIQLWEHGITSPTGDPEGMAEALRYLANQPAEGRRMGERGRDFVFRELGIDRLTRDMEALYRRLLGVNPQSVPSRTVEAVA
ncbi:MAG: glycosyltransferase [Acidobacteria bacterium]|nr:glycosyltransferase [Acidobacteriota bacterium]